MKIANFEKKLTEGNIVIMDGATGTEIQRRGVKTTLPLWSAGALLNQPEVVREIHSDYIKAGAEIIITNTFRTTERTLLKAGQKNRAKEITVLACKLALESVKSSGKKNVFVAGSIAPLEDCYSPQLTPPEAELVKEHSEYAKNLAAGGVDFILIETMITLRETRAALEAVKKTGLRVAVSFCTNEKAKLLGGESLEAAVKLAERYNPIFIGVNCVSPKIVNEQMKLLKKITKIPLCAYAHGSGQPSDDEGWKFDESDTGKKYLGYAKNWVKSGAQIIGGCCGTTPEYIKTLSSSFNN